jgi:hypothetical protein
MIAKALMTVPSFDEEFRYYGPRPAWQWVDVAELWRFRELVWTFAQRDLKIRYRQTAVGAAWAEACQAAASAKGLVPGVASSARARS